MTNPYSSGTPILRNLIPGQYQIGNLVFGKATTVRVESFDIKPYDVNTQDYQVSRSDEMRFGWDSLKPTTIEITFHVLYNKLLPGYEDLIPNFWAEMPTVEDFQREWKSSDIRQIWGQMKPLYYCANDGITRAIFGRCGQFQYGKLTEYTEAVQCLGEFRRADTRVYSASEYVVELSNNADASYLTRLTGDSDSWLRIIGVGPLTNPVITVGEQQIQLDYTFADGEIFEISSYPWQRRAINSDRINLSSHMLGPTMFLDRISIPAYTATAVRWSSDDKKTWVPALGDHSWIEDMSKENWFKLNQDFTMISGKPVVYFDWVNPIAELLQIFLPLFFGRPRKYLGPGPWGSHAAVIYNRHQFNSAAQYAEATVVPAFPPGSAAIVIMSNATMTSFVCLEVQQGTTNYLRIRSGTAWNATTIRAQWQKTGIWTHRDKVAIDFDPVSKTYTGYLNGEPKLTWVDSGVAVPTTNIYQGFIFDLGDNLFTAGPGFTNIVCYDKGTAVAGGQIFLLWRDAWSTVI